MPRDPHRRAPTPQESAGREGDVRTWSDPHRFGKRTPWAAAAGGAYAFGFPSEAEARAAAVALRARDEAPADAS